MPLLSIKDLLSGGIKGIADSFSDIVTKFKADPTKVAEMQSSLEQAKIAASLKAEELSNQAEETYAKDEARKQADERRGLLLKERHDAKRANRVTFVSNRNTQKTHESLCNSKQSSTERNLS